MIGGLLLGSCGSIVCFLCHGWQTFSGVRVAQSLVFYVIVGRLLVGFVLLNLQFSVSWQVDFQWGSCVSIFCFLCHGWQTLVGFVWLYLQFSVSWQVDFQWGSCGSIFSFLCHGRQTFSGVRVAQSLVFCVMVGRLLGGFVRLNLQFSVSWLIDFQSGSCGSIFSFLCHGWQTFSGLRVSQSLVFCVMVGRLFVGFVWLNLQISVSCQVDFQWGSCGSIFCFLCHGWQTFRWVRVLYLQFSVLWQVDFQWGSCGSIFRFLCHVSQTFSGVRVSQSLIFWVMVGRLLVGFVRLNLQFSVSWLIDFQWGSCGSIFSLLCHGRQSFSGVRVSQSLVFCVMVGRLLVGFVWLNLQFSVSWLVDFQWGSWLNLQFFRLLVGFVWLNLYFSVMVGRLLVGFVWLNLQFSVSCQVYFQWGSCLNLQFSVMVGRLLVGFVWLNLQFSVSWFRVDFQWVRVAQSLISVSLLVGFLAQVFCVMVGRLLVGFVWLNLQFSVSWLVDFQWGSCGSIFSFLCHGWQTFSGVRVSQSLVFCVMVGRLLVGFVWLNLQFSHGWQTFSGVREAQSLVFCVQVGDFQWGSCGSIFIFLSHGWQTFRGVRVAQSLVFCVIVCILLVGFVYLNLQFSASWLGDFQWGS